MYFRFEVFTSSLHQTNIKWCLSSSGSKRPYCSGQILFKFYLPLRQKAAITYKQFRRSVI